jgi:hypothetical protein
MKTYSCKVVVEPDDDRGTQPKTASPFQIARAKMSRCCPTHALL